MNGSIQSILMIHNHYQQPGGEDIAFAADKILLQQNGLQVIEYVDTNKGINNISSYSAVMTSIRSQKSFRALSQSIKSKKLDIANFNKLAQFNRDRLEKFRTGITFSYFLIRFYRLTVAILRLGTTYTVEFVLKLCLYFLWFPKPAEKERFKC